MTTLTDRYVYATLRNVPEARRDEIGAELRASIDDMVEARVSAGEPATDAEREVLTELGNPERLASNYVDRSLYLIGPDFYLAWRKLLITLLAFVPVTVALIMVVVDVVDDEPVGSIIGGAVGVAIEVAVQIAFWVTLTFAIIDRTGSAKHMPPWSVDLLPDVREPSKISLSETIATVAFLVIAIGFFPYQHFRSWIEGADGDRLPLVNPDLWSSWIPVLIIVLVAEILFAVAVYRVGRMTNLLAGVNLLIGLAFAIPAIWLLSQERLVNPAVIDRFDWLSDNFGQITTWAIVGIVAVTIWEAVEAFVKAYRQR